MPRQAPAEHNSGAVPLPHWAARLEDRVHEWRERRVRKRGYLTTVIPYTGYGSGEWVRVLGRVLLTKPVKPGSRAERLRAKRDQSIRGWRSFTSVPVNDVTVTIEIDGHSHSVQADRGGVVDTVVPVALTPGWHTATMRTDDSIVVEAPVYVVAPDARFGIVSDVDDTVMVTALPRPLLAAWNTFVLDEHARIPTPGMAVLLERLASENRGCPVIYLSTGAWNVAPTLTRFLSRNLYPAGALLLTDWGPTHDRMFRSGRLHKEQSLRRLADEFPDIRWLLIGDDGQHDEEIYGQFARERPEAVAAVAIRQLSPGEAVLAGGRSKAEAHDSGVPWVYAPDGAGLSDQLTEHGLI
ncbi:App1 family protein [Compostimonas suwonensis]|uniref:Phosphatidate phosphatase APP1 n=1 Tax=Compostimonas suwonensis TaxID=1048394 RepID=A0A2M9BZ83_9MICO|nr:phosphatase domain-containing protein [Compostimonas suwonensis]PJJ63393.1 phosphatidate phosphatase APP1 [Compostimonas suwonensis]